MKRMFTLFLALALSLSLAPAAFAFEASRTYTPGQFKDVPADSWCSDNVKLVYENNIMGGFSSDNFGVKGTMTVAQAMVIACRIHAESHQKEIPTIENASVWYQPHMEYAKENGLWVSSDGNYNRAVTRSEFVTILSIATSDDDMKNINTVDSGAIPDVDSNASYAQHVYRFYRAGILTGNDAKGTFAPNNTITRGAAAAIISRIIDSSLRTSITLKNVSSSASVNIGNTTTNDSQIVDIKNLAHYDELKKNLTDEQFQEAYDVALTVVKSLVGKDKETQVKGVYGGLKEFRAHNAVMDNKSEPHNDDVYGYFIKRYASDNIGTTDACSLCLDMLGLTYEHAHTNDGVYHWCRIDMGNGTYWICDAQSHEWGSETELYKDSDRLEKYSQWGNRNA